MSKEGDYNLNSAAMVNKNLLYLQLVFTGRPWRVEYEGEDEKN